MQGSIRWARVLGIASGLTLLVAGVSSSSASAHGASRSHAGNLRHASILRAPQVSQAKGRTLIFGSGDTADAGPPLDINPGEPLSDLASILASAGYGVDTDQSSTLPTNIKQYRAIWYISTDPLSATEESQLETFVQGGGGLYLTGESPCCENLNAADGSVVDALVSGGGVQVGGMGFANNGSEPEAVTTNAIDDVSAVPNALTSWTPSQPGGIGDVGSANVLTSTTFGNQVLATGAVWDGSTMVSGSGRLALLMDINWLETQTWDQTTATQMVVNLERFLMSALPVPASANAHWAGYATKTHGVQDVNGEWTIPSVDCSQATKASALRIWVGIDGFGNKDLANAGVGVTCGGPTGSPCYYLFTGVHLSDETPVTECDVVGPGDDVSVDVVNQPFGSSTFLATITVNGNVVDGEPFTLSEPSKRDASAECVVELPSGLVGPGTPERYRQLANFSTPISFTDCAATATQNAGNSPDSEQLATGTDGTFVVKALNMGNGLKPLATTTAATLPSEEWSVNWLRG
jgi:hypothetical protein